MAPPKAAGVVILLVLMAGCAAGGSAPVPSEPTAGHSEPPYLVPKITTTAPSFPSAGPSTTSARPARPTQVSLPTDATEAQKRCVDVSTEVTDVLDQTIAAATRGDMVIARQQRQAWTESQTEMLALCDQPTLDRLMSGLVIRLWDHYRQSEDGARDFIAEAGQDVCSETAEIPAARTWTLSAEARDHCVTLVVMHFEAEPDVGADVAEEVYLSVLRRWSLGDPADVIEQATDPELIRLGDLVCTSFNQGRTYEKVVGDVVEGHGSTGAVDVEASALIVEAAVESFCPEHASLVRGSG